MRKLPAFALDIDGVLLKGKNIFNFSSSIISYLNNKNLPFIFMTNGGGVTEYMKSLQLSDVFNNNITNKHILLSHTPMINLLPFYNKKLIMVSGSSYVDSIARSYGFKNVINIADVCFQYPNSFTHGPLVPYDFMPDKKAPILKDLTEIEAIFVMHDGVNWGSEFQTIIDVLYAHYLKYGKQTPLYFTNADFLFTTTHQYPRLAQGAVSTCLSALWKNLTGKELEYQMFGKPTESTYKMAETMLLEHKSRLNIDPSVQLEFYGIGDNPKADIRGANLANNARGHTWKSVLVKTGLADKNCEVDKAELVYDNVEDAVKSICKKYDL